MIFLCSVKIIMLMHQDIMSTYYDTQCYCISVCCSFGIQRAGDVTTVHDFQQTTALDTYVISDNFSLWKNWSFTVLEFLTNIRNSELHIYFILHGNKHSRKQLLVKAVIISDRLIHAIASTFCKSIFILFKMEEVVYYLKWRKLCK
jgi:hypothetical protein